LSSDFILSKRAALGSGMSASEPKGCSRPNIDKSVAAERGIPLRELVTEAVKEKPAHNRGPSYQPWMTAFGKLRRLRKEKARINRVIEEEFEHVEAEYRR
jgi:hypothetical protein